MINIDSTTVESLFELYRGGDLQNLINRAKALLASHPEELVLHSLLGAAYLDLEDYDNAIENYRLALSIKPNFEKLHNSLGVAYLRRKMFAEAIASFRNAIFHNPQFAQAYFNLGLVFENQQNWEEAVDHYTKALVIEPNYVAALTALGTVLWELGQHGQVAEYFAQALALKRDYLPAHRGLLLFLEQSNQAEELRLAVSRARSALGDHVLVRIYEGVMADIEQDYPRAKSILESFSIAPCDRFSSHDERQRLARLVNICDRLSKEEEAIKYAQMANRLSSELSASKGINKGTFLRFVESRYRYFTEETTKTWQCSPTGERTAQLVFIVGFPRSGTTLLDTILRGHPSIAIAEEVGAVSRMVNQVAGHSDEYLHALAGLSSNDIGRLRATYLQALPEQVSSEGEETLVIDRFAINIIYVGEICRIFPDARFILMLRHPAGCVLSCFMRTFYETSLNANFYTLKDTADLYSKVFSLWTQCRDALQPKVITVKYEDLIADLEKTCRSILDFLGLPWHPELANSSRTAIARDFIKTVSCNQVTQPIYSEANGRWLRYRMVIDPILPKLEPWIERFGY